MSWCSPQQETGMCTKCARKSSDFMKMALDVDHHDVCREELQIAVVQPARPADQPASVHRGRGGAITGSPSISRKQMGDDRAPVSGPHRQRREEPLACGDGPKVPRQYLRAPQDSTPSARDRTPLGPVAAQSVRHRDQNLPRPVRGFASRRETRGARHRHLHSLHRFPGSRDRGLIEASIPCTGEPNAV